MSKNYPRHFLVKLFPEVLDRLPDDMPINEVYEFIGLIGDGNFDINVDRNPTTVGELKTFIAEEVVVADKPKSYFAGQIEEADYWQHPWLWFEGYTSTPADYVLEGLMYGVRGSEYGKPDMRKGNLNEFLQ